MKKLLPVLLVVLLVPSLGWSQGNFLQISSLNGKVEIRPGSSKVFESLTNSVRTVQVGDEIHTGPGASVVLELPDKSYMKVNENTDLVIRDFWTGGSLRSVVNVLLGRVRFYVEKVGGRSNPYRVLTPTALIAVRGTIFDVDVDASSYTEVSCLEGQVTVENLDLADREVIVNPGFHTGVSAAQNPLTPIEMSEELSPNRTLKIVKKGPKVDDKSLDPRSLEKLLRDNDRSNRPTDRYKQAPSGTDSNTGRAKPSMTYPE